ncbi:outer membrane beta-barrel protein [Breoghania sp.]|uniref:outer membrane beta-barrel protein n=1 Tax=Breoghania sp. TaxID=2065378 RepID=UPI002AAB2E97|nr:outer membrane beta-barrel protein [Breoghania sp.]
MNRILPAFCVMAVATAAAAQTSESAYDSDFLRGTLETGQPGGDVEDGAAGDDFLIFDGASDAAASNAAGSKVSPGAQKAASDNKTASGNEVRGSGRTSSANRITDTRAGPVPPSRPIQSAGPLAPVAPAAPLTTGSIGAATDRDAPFGGDTLRDQPQGIRVGTFLLYPELILRAGASSNVEGVAGGEGGTLARVEPSLRLSSDWDRHSLEATFRGTFTGYPDPPAGTSSSESSAEASATLRIDAGEVTTLETRAGYTVSPESQSSPESAGGAKRTYQHGVSGSLAVTRDAGLVAVTLRGNLDATLYSGGTEVGNRDNMVASGSVRLGYNLRATLSPFAEATVLGRFFDDGSKRNAKGYALRSGLGLNAGPKLTGEVGIGWRSEDLEGAVYKKLQGLLADADLVWSPSRLTTVRLNASTAFEASSLAGASGSLVHSGTLSVAHSLTNDLAVTVSGGVARRDYQGVELSELTYTGSALATYAISDIAALQAQYSFERVDSSRVGQDYNSHTIEAGVRIRR